MHEIFLWQPWKDTSGTESLKDLGLDLPDEVDFPEEMSEFEILALRAASESEVRAFWHALERHDFKVIITRCELFVILSDPFGFRSIDSARSDLKTKLSVLRWCHNLMSALCFELYTPEIAD